LNEYVSNERLRLLISGSAVCVFPYLSATGTATIQTALALGAPCIVSKISAFEEISTQVGGAGIYIFSDDSELDGLILGFSTGVIKCNRVLLAERARDVFSTARFGGKVSLALRDFT
jgi:hypothetical protein